MDSNTNKISQLKQVLKQTKRKILISLFVSVIAIVAIILLAGILSKSSFGGDVFYYKVDGAKSNIFYIKDDNKPEYLISILSEKIDEGGYKVPQHVYMSHNKDILIYFEKIKEIPIEEVADGYTAYRKIYQPKYVDLKTGSVSNIEQSIDSGSLLFSPNDNKIAWILRVEESTIKELEKNETKREVWLSDSNGDNAQKLATLDEKVVLLRRWNNDYIYFWGIRGVGFYGLGMIDIKTGEVEYIKPKYCVEDLANCQNFQLSFSGNFFIYEAVVKKDGGERFGLFIESMDSKKSWEILVDNYISDKIWLPDEKRIIYTDQISDRKLGLREKIHIVDLTTEEDKEIYSGSYISQIVPDSSGRYLYFIEKEENKKFNLTRLDIEKGTTKIIDSGEYDHLKIFSGL